MVNLAYVYLPLVIGLLSCLMKAVCLDAWRRVELVVESAEGIEVLWPLLIRLQYERLSPPREAHRILHFALDGGSVLQRIVRVTNDPFDGVLAQLLLLERAQVAAGVLELVVWIFDYRFADG